jgi:hypothetical protein
MNKAAAVTAAAAATVTDGHPCDEVNVVLLVAMRQVVEQSHKAQIDNSDIERINMC